MKDKGLRVNMDKTKILVCRAKPVQTGKPSGKWPCGGEVEEAVRCRVRCAWGKFNELMPILTMRGTSLKVKGKIYKACVQSVMMYGSETWAIKVEDTQKLKRTEASMMRRMCGVSLKKHLSNEALRGRLGIDCVSDLVRRSRLRWFGHVVRKDEQQWVKKCT